MTIRRVAITGCSGQVVSAVLERSAFFPDLDVIPIGRPNLDLLQVETIETAIVAAQPDAIISAAAFTGVDQAESEEDLAVAINGRAPGVLGTIATKLGIPIVHLSTDYVFDGLKNRPYVETDPTSPLGVYGRSKLMGEYSLAKATENHAILRVAWLYSSFGRNFLKTMLQIAEKRDTVSVVNDQIGNPTSAFDVADSILAVTRNLINDPASSLRGTFHMTAEGSASWAEFATEIFRLSRARGGPSAIVSPIPSSEYPTPARRPVNSRLDSSKLQLTHGIGLPAWHASTRQVIERLIP